MYIYIYIYIEIYIYIYVCYGRFVGFGINTHYNTYIYIYTYICRSCRIWALVKYG